jgi:surface antigen
LVRKAISESDLSEICSMRAAIIFVSLVGPLGLAGCSGGGAVAPAPVTATPAAAPAEPAAPAIPSGAALGGVLGGSVGAGLSDDDRAAAWNAQIAALDSGQRRSWRGSHGVFGFVETGPETGDGCRAYSQTIYVAGRATHGHGVGCKQPDGSWKMTS